MTKSIKASFLRRNALFRNFLSASSVSLLGTSVFDIAIPIYVAAKTQSVYALAAVTIALHLPFFLMAPITGYSVDNFDKRRIMLYSDIGQVFCLILLLGYEYFSAEALWPLLLTVFVAKTLMIAFETVATFQLIPALVSKADLSEANTWFLSSQRFIQIVGPLLAGTMMGFFGITSCILINIASFGATLYYVLKMKNLSELLDEGKKPGSWRSVTLGAIAGSFQDSFRFIWSSKLFRPFVIMMFLWNLSSINPNYPTITYYFTILKKFPPQQYGFIISLFGFLGIFGFIYAGPIYRRMPFNKAFVGGGIWLALTASLSLFFYESPLLLGVMMAISKVGSSVLSMGTFYLRQTHIPRQQVGGVNACLRMMFMSATPISCLIQPLIVEHLGALTSFILGAICLWSLVWYSNKVAKSYLLVVADSITESKAAA